MSEKRALGVTFDEGTIDQIEQLRRERAATGDGSIPSRSEIVRELVGLGLQATETIESQGHDVSLGRGREKLLRQALIDHFREEAVEG